MASRSALHRRNSVVFLLTFFLILLVWPFFVSKCFANMLCFLIFCFYGHLLVFFCLFLIMICLVFVLVVVCLFCCLCLPIWVQKELDKGYGVELVRIWEELGEGKPWLKYSICISKTLNPVEKIKKEQKIYVYMLDSQWIMSFLSNRIEIACVLWMDPSKSQLLIMTMTVCHLQSLLLAYGKEATDFPLTFKVESQKLKHT